jgi:hypothetical protein
LISAVPGLLAQEINLFNGRDLQGWEPSSNAWSVEDGAITAKLLPGSTIPAHSLVWKGTVSDFDLSCKSKLTPIGNSEHATLAIGFRSTAINPGRFTGYQAEMDLGNLRLTGLDSESSLNGSLLYIVPPPDKRITKVLALPGQRVVAHEGEVGNRQLNTQVVGSLGLDAEFRALFKPREWNDYRVICAGNHIQIFVNGRQTVDVVDEGNRPKSGLLVFVVPDGREPKTIQFKDIKLRVLTVPIPSDAQTMASANLGAATAASTTVYKPDQSPIEILKEQGPNISAWVSSTLDTPIPEAIWENMTFLKEALRDEAAQKPRASTVAYGAALRLCAIILDDLAERKVTVTKAGGDAVLHQGSHLTESRRDHLTWPMYALERDERGERKLWAQQHHSELVQWAKRTNDMRTDLGIWYNKFREALRQGPAAK